jgi:hypothetical protein
MNKAMARRLAFNLKTVYLCNYNVIIFIWAAMGTICSRRTTHHSVTSPLAVFPNRSLNDTQTIVSDGLLYFRIYPWAGSLPSLQWMHILQSFSLSAVWALIVALGFSILNQRQPTSIQEGKFNKPWRPLPSHRITPSQASILLIVTSIVGFLFSTIVSSLGPYLIQFAASYHYNDLGGAQGHYVIRNVLNAIGMTGWLFGCIEVAGGPGFRFSNSQLVTSIVLMAAITTTIAIQDFRDLDGDRKCGRATLPIVLGHSTARIILAASILLWSFGPVMVLNLSSCQRYQAWEY